MHDQLPGAEIRRHAEERQRQILDRVLAELAAQEARDLPARHEGHQRQRVVVHRIRVDEAASHSIAQLFVAPFAGHASRDQRADARAADCIDHDASFSQCA
jgi:hypothetical protein